MQKLKKEDLLKFKNEDEKNCINFNINEFQIYLVDRDNIKVVDKEDNYLYFNYDSSTKEVTYQDELMIKENDYEIGL